MEEPPHCLALQQYKTIRSQGVRAPGITDMPSGQFKQLQAMDLERRSRLLHVIPCGQTQHEHVPAITMLTLLSGRAILYMNKGQTPRPKLFLENNCVW